MPLIVSSAFCFASFGTSMWTQPSAAVAATTPGPFGARSNRRHDPDFDVGDRLVLADRAAVQLIVDRAGCEVLLRLELRSALTSRGSGGDSSAAGGRDLLLVARSTRCTSRSSPARPRASRVPCRRVSSSCCSSFVEVIDRRRRRVAFVAGQEITTPSWASSSDGIREQPIDRRRRAAASSSRSTRSKPLPSRSVNSTRPCRRCRARELDGVVGFVGDEEHLRADRGSDP